MTFKGPFQLKPFYDDCIHDSTTLSFIATWYFLNMVDINASCHLYRQMSPLTIKFEKIVFFVFFNYFDLFLPLPFICFSIQASDALALL